MRDDKSDAGAAGAAGAGAAGAGAAGGDSTYFCPGCGKSTPKPGLCIGCSSRKESRDASVAAGVAGTAAGISTEGMAYKFSKMSADALKEGAAHDMAQRQNERQIQEQAIRSFEEKIKSRQVDSKMRGQAEEMVQAHAGMIAELRSKGVDVSHLESGVNRMSSNLSKNQYVELLNELNAIGEEIRRRYYESLG